MNQDHQESIDLYMKVFFKKEKGWKIIGIDSEGFDLRSGENVLRYYFGKPIKKTKVTPAAHKSSYPFSVSILFGLIIAYAGGNLISGI